MKLSSDGAPLSLVQEPHTLANLILVLSVSESGDERPFFNQCLTFGKFL